MRQMSRQRIRPAMGLGCGVGLFTLLMVGVPTAVLPNDRFIRLTPTRPLDVVFLALTSLLATTLGATVAISVTMVRRLDRRVVGISALGLVAANYLTTLAIGCPTCNVTIVRLFGLHGAQTTFARVQPLLGLGALVLLAALLVRLLAPAFRMRTQQSSRPDGAAGGSTIDAVGTSFPRRRTWTLMASIAAAILGIVFLLRPAAQAGSAPSAPNFTLPTAANARGMLSLHRLRGHAVLLNFFNTQCVPCIEEMPTLRESARRYRGAGVRLLGVATGGDTVASARRFAQEQRMSFPVVADEHQDVAWRYAVGGWPTSFFIDARGKLQGHFIGPLDAGVVRDGLAQAGALHCATCSSIPGLTLGTVSVGGGTLTAEDARLPGDVIFTPAHRASPFALRDQNGTMISPTRLRGRVIALTFLSAACTSQCPLIGEALGQVSRALGRRGARLSIVAISIYPEGDSPRTTRRFAERAGWRGMDWHYLTASRAALTRVWSAYGVPVGPRPADGHDPSHQGGLYILDTMARLRVYDDVPFLVPRVATTMRLLLTHGAR